MPILDWESCHKCQLLPGKQKPRCYVRCRKLRDEAEKKLANLKRVLVDERTKSIERLHRYDSVDERMNDDYRKMAEEQIERELKEPVTTEPIYIRERVEEPYMAVSPAVDGGDYAVHAHIMESDCIKERRVVNGNTEIILSRPLLVHKIVLYGKLHDVVVSIIDILGESHIIDEHVEVDAKWDSGWFVPLVMASKIIVTGEGFKEEVFIL